MSEKTRYKLTSSQWQILILLYKFRFITVPLLTEHKGLKSNSIQRTLDILVEKQLIDRKWDKTFIKAEQPAIYYLTKQGIAVLRGDERFSLGVLNTYYRNPRASHGFMLHKLDTLRAYLAIKAIYGDTYQIFTQQEVMSFDDFPPKKPDLFLRAKEGSKEYFVNLVHDTQPYLYRKHLKELIRHYDEEGWENGDYPTLLYVFSDSNQEQAFLKYAKKQREDEGLDDDELSVGGTTLKALLAKPYYTDVWSFTGDTAPIGLE